MQEFKVQHKNLGDILLLGDLNARIVLENPIFDDEDLEYLKKDKPGSHPESNQRASKNAVVSARGRLLLDFLSCSGLQVQLNRRVLGDVL